MNTPTLLEGVRHRRSVFFGALSIAAPVLGYIVLRSHVSGPEDMAGYARVLLVLGGSLGLGTLFAIIAAFRRESPIAVTVIGFLVNLALPLAAFIYFMRHA